jgi:NAD(P)H-nitrite reductase large subunit
MDDARRIITRAVPGSRVLQIGAGFIGCIIMEALKSRGVDLTVVEMGDRMVPRMMTPVAGAMIRRWCERAGVTVHVGAHVKAIRRADGREALVATLDSGQEIEAETLIVAAGVRPNVEFLRGSGVDCENGISVDAPMQTNIAGVYAAGDVAAVLDFATGVRGMYAIQPNAVEQARIAALNMAGKHAESHGSMALNVLDTLGLVSTSFGQWSGVAGGQSVELVDHDEFRYLCLQFGGDVLIGATAIGLTEGVGMLRGLIEGRVRLGPWKDRLLAEPLRFPDAYLARAQAAA